jgi:CubicO group peptidase (beta-lactamase class C family)
MSFDDTLEKMFPELVPQMQPAYRKVTVRMLLSHTSGLPLGPSKTGPRKPIADPEQAIAARYTYVRNALVEKPVAKPGTKNVYTGACIIAVNYAERKLKKPYEDLMEQYLFRKLGMTTAGAFRMATLPDKMDGPWPHHDQGGRITFLPPKIDRGMSRAPAGQVCCSIIDLGKWAAAHLEGERGHSSVLKAATFRQLHALVTPPGKSTMSLARHRPGWAKGDVLWHNGCDGTCFALVQIVPQEDFAVCMATNYGGRGAKDACNKELAQLLVKRAREQRGGRGRQARR